MGLTAPLPYAPENPGLLEELKSWTGENRVTDPLAMDMSVPELAVFAKMVHGVGLTPEDNWDTVMDSTKSLNCPGLSLTLGGGM